MNFKKIMITLFLLNVFTVNAFNDPEIFNINTHTNTSNGTDKHNNYFNQNVKLRFYENMEECLNNEDILLKTNNNYDMNCNCLNTSQCMNTLFNSRDFKSQRWKVNNTFVNGSQCEFKTGRVCDMCGSYSVRADIVLFGNICINRQISNILLILFIMCGCITCVFGLVYCMYNIIFISDGNHVLIRRRRGYSNLINNTEKNTGKPPSYNGTI